MRHLIYKLSFTTPVHFGSDDGGDRLSAVRMSFRSDTLFSALFVEALRAGCQEQLLAAVSGGSLGFSDAMPWQKEKLFIPRPMGMFVPPVREEDPSRRKLMKKVEFLPFDKLTEYLSGTASPTELLATFGRTFETTRVNIRDEEDPLPYQVSAYRFAPDTGLYIIVNAESENDEQLMDLLMGMLAYSGIGGKTSSGWGKFEYTKETADALLSNLLEAAGAPQQLLISTAYPEESELDSILQDACYNLVRRGGFSFSEHAQPMKKRTCYVFGAGSVFTRRFSGTIMDVGLNMPHPVYRCAKAVFMGVNI